MIYFLSIYVIGLLAFLIHTLLLPVQKRTRAKLIELFLLYQIVFSLGVTSLVSFYGFTFMPQYIADYTGWQSCPFQQQLGNVNLAFGILGLLAIWFRKGFWLATVIGFNIWIFGDAIHHLYHYLAEDNATLGNVGVPLWTDIIVPLVLTVFTWLYYRDNKDMKEPARIQRTQSHKKSKRTKSRL